MRMRIVGYYWNTVIIQIEDRKNSGWEQVRMQFGEFIAFMHKNFPKHMAEMHPVKSMTDLIKQLYEYGEDDDDDTYIYEEG